MKKPVGLIRWVIALVLIASGVSCRSSGGAHELTADSRSLSWKGRAAGTPVSSREGVHARRRAGVGVPLRVELGSDHWERRPGSVRIGVRWQRPDALVGEASGDLLGLWLVDDEGEIVAAGSEDVDDIATAQMVDAGALVDGTYELFVAPIRAQHDVPYDVTVDVADKGKAGAPDLVTRQPANLTFDASPPTSKRRSDTSCLAIETAVKASLSRCLRFDAVISNHGDGPFIVEAKVSEALDGGLPEGEEVRGPASQVLAGGKRRQDVARWVIDAEHHHVHIEELASYELFSVSKDGNRDLRVTDEKIGFCPWDLADEWFGRSGNEVRRYRPTACDVGDATDAHELGISPGWGDVYPANRPMQYLDVSGVPDGTYDVLVRVDPNDAFEETDEDNNEATTRIELEGDEIRCVPEPYGCPPSAIGR